MALRALILEDEPADAELVLRELSRGRDVTAEVVASEAATRAALARAV